MDVPISRSAAYVMRNRTTHSWYQDSSVMSASCPSAHTLEDHMRRARATRTSAMAQSVHSSNFHRGSAASDGVDGAVTVVKGGGRATTGFAAPPSSSASSPGATRAIINPGTGERVERNHRRRKTTHLDLDSGRPSSAYSYDGGFFITANNHGKDFFVINPEWVSEDETVKKMSGGAEVKLVMSQKPEKGAAAGAGVDVVDAPVTVQKPKLITWKSYSKRSRSAPPARFRNPITWVNP